MVPVTLNRAELAFDVEDPRGTLRWQGDGEIDLTFCFIMDYVRESVLDPRVTNYINSINPTGIET